MQLFRNAFACDDFDAVRVSHDGIESLAVEVEAQLRSKPDGTHHTERVVGESDVRVKRRTDDAALQISDSVEGVEQLTVTRRVQTDGHCVNREIAAVLVFLQCAVFDDGIATVVLITLAPCADELQF